MVSPGRNRPASRYLLLAQKACKHAYRRVRGPAINGERSLLFILGCQRSGTTLATRIFDRDWNARVFPEFSELSSQDCEFGIRLNSLASVSRIIREQPYAFVIAKPLVESQRAAELLQHFPGSNVLWMYRSFIDVVASNLAKFGERSGIDNIRPIVFGAANNWRSEQVSDSVRELITKYFSEDMNPMDAACLFWFARNSLFFDENLDSAPLADRVLLMRYERLTRSPTQAMEAVYRLVGRTFPGSRIVREVDPVSVGKGRGRALEISPEVRHSCESLLQRLDAAAGYYDG